jgi:argininosuccinate lyase
VENTGRIRKQLAPAIRRIIFAPVDEHHATAELAQIIRVDQAHLVMLTECGIVAEDRAARVLNAIERLASAGFAPLLGREAGRGLFLLYEDFLIASEGAAVGGILQTARSRNDLNATVLKLRLRQPYLGMLEQLLRLIAVLLQRAERYRGVTMPLYTHGQPAMPGSYGHYLAGVASALLRDCAALLHGIADLESCPLGAGALAGSSFPINTVRTAELLGFEHGPLHSLDAVASRDFLLRLLSAAAICAVTLSRLATDLLQWTTGEFDFLHLPDELVGSSSAMPQKRNPFLLEHVQGRSASLLGALVHAAAAMHATPFTNSIAVGTEAVKPVWDALRNATQMMTIMRHIVAAARPNQEAMARRAAEGFTTATELANCLVREADLDFRSAHRITGELVLAAHESGTANLQEVAAAHFKEHGITPIPSLDPSSVAAMLQWGGGPGAASLQTCLEHLRRLWRDQREQKRTCERKWRRAEARLRQAVDKYTKTEHPVAMAMQS